MTLAQSDEAIGEKRKFVKGHQQENDVKIEANYVGGDRAGILKGFLLILSITSVLQFVLIIMTITQVSHLQTRITALDEDMEKMQSFAISCSRSEKPLNSFPPNINDNTLMKENKETIDDETTKQFKFEDLENSADYDDEIIPGLPRNQEISYKNVAAPVLKRTKRRSKKGKSKKKKGRTKAVKYSKAIGIHVKAGEVGSGNHGLPTAKLIKGWSDDFPPGSTASFDTSKLKTEGYLRVLRTGLYFLYSQVVVENPNTTYITAELDVGTRGTRTFSKCTFSEPTSSTSSNGGGRRLTCNTNGVVALQKDDGVSIRVYPPNVEIVTAPEYTYFGAFMIGTL